MPQLFEHVTSVIFFSFAEYVFDDPRINGEGSDDIVWSLYCRIFSLLKSGRWNRFPMTMMWCEKWHCPHIDMYLILLDLNLSVFFLARMCLSRRTGVMVHIGRLIHFQWWKRKSELIFFDVDETIVLEEGSSCGSFWGKLAKQSSVSISATNMLLRSLIKWKERMFIS